MKILTLHFFIAVFIIPMIATFYISRCSFDMGISSVKCEIREQNMYELEDEKSHYNSDSSTSSSNSRTTFIKHYFNHLTYNYGKNEFGSCGYIALGMLLTYFDTYWNDNIVLEVHDKTVNISSLNTSVITESPGSLERETNINNSLSYYNYMINDLSSTSLHAYLLKLGNEMGFSMSTTVSEIYDILLRYISQNPYIDSSDFYITKAFNYTNANSLVPGEIYTYSDLYMQNIINLVRSGYPVYVAIGSSDSNIGHAVVAYDCEDLDSLYAHFGWYNVENSEHKYIFSSGYNYIRGYLAIMPLSAHNHSNNYLLNLEEVCSCSLSNHIHSYSNISIDNNRHKTICYCGNFSYNFHIFRIQGKNYVCIDCGFSKPYDGGNIEIIHPGSIVIEDLLSLGIISEGEKL